MGTKLILVFAMGVLFVITPSIFAGTVVAWGKSDDGELNVPSGDDFIDIAAGYHHCLALRSDGSIAGWGQTPSGQFSPPPGNDFIDIACGVSHSLALKSDGSIVAWGDNYWGNLDVPSGDDFTDIAAGYYHSLALKFDGSIVGWGYNGNNRIDVPDGGNFVGIAAGGSHSLALKSDGSIVAWGFNGNGQCNAPTSNDFISIAAGAQFSLALKSDGSLIAWGFNGSGECDVPIGNDFIEIAAGRHSLALKSDGSIVGWGYNSYGECDVPIGNDFINLSAGGFHSLALISKAATPPIADADGPYIVYVGDVFTLDANGSTDDDNDIVSYLWDLDDNGSFETDAGGQAIFDVNYTYLESLGLLVNHTYNIYLKVTDSEGQSDVNDSTLTIIPKPALVVAVDIKPGSCPNPMNVKSSGVLPVAILGTEGLDVSEIVPTSIRLAGVEAIRNDYEDVAAPVADVNDCNCTTEGPDGYLDLTLKFATQEIVEAIGEVNDGDVVTLELTGVLFGERPIEGADCIVIRGRHKPFNQADINKDGVVNNIDFAVIAENWLQSSVLDN